MTRTLLILSLILLSSCKEVRVIRPPTIPDTRINCSNDLPGARVAYKENEDSACKILACNTDYTLYDLTKLIDRNRVLGRTLPEYFLQVSEQFPKVCVYNNFGSCISRPIHSFDWGDDLPTPIPILITNGILHWMPIETTSFNWELSSIPPNLSSVEKILYILTLEGNPTLTYDHFNDIPYHERACHPVDKDSCHPDYEFYPGRDNTKSACILKTCPAGRFEVLKYSSEGDLLYKDCYLSYRAPTSCDFGTQNGTVYGERLFSPETQSYGECLPSHTICNSESYRVVDYKCVVDYCFIDPLSNECAAQNQ